MLNAYKNARASKCHQMHVKQRSNIFPIYLLFIYLFIFFNKSEFHYTHGKLVQENVSRKKSNTQIRSIRRCLRWFISWNKCFYCHVCDIDAI